MTTVVNRYPPRGLQRAATDSLVRRYVYSAGLVGVSLTFTMFNSHIILGLKDSKQAQKHIQGLIHWEHLELLCLKMPSGISTLEEMKNRLSIQRRISPSCKVKFHLERIPLHLKLANLCRMVV